MDSRIVRRKPLRPARLQVQLEAVSRSQEETARFVLREPGREQWDVQGSRQMSRLPSGQIGDRTKRTDTVSIRIQIGPILEVVLRTSEVLERGDRRALVGTGPDSGVTWPPADPGGESHGGEHERRRDPRGQSPMSGQGAEGGFGHGCWRSYRQVGPADRTVGCKPPTPGSHRRRGDDQGPDVLCSAADLPARNELVEAARSEPEPAPCLQTGEQHEGLGERTLQLGHDRIERHGSLPQPVEDGCLLCRVERLEWILQDGLEPQVRQQTLRRIRQEGPVADQRMTSPAGLGLVGPGSAQTGFP